MVLSVLCFIVLAELVHLHPLNIRTRSFTLGRYHCPVTLPDVGASRAVIPKYTDSTVRQCSKTCFIPPSCYILVVCIESSKYEADLFVLHISQSKSVRSERASLTLLHDGRAPPSDVAVEPGLVHMPSHATSSHRVVLVSHMEAHYSSKYCSCIYHCWTVAL